MYWALAAGSFVLGMFPGIGLASYIPSKMANNMKAEAEHDSIADHYRLQIAERLGVAPTAVTREHLYEAAAHDAGFSKLLESSMKQKASDDRKAGITAGLSGVAGAVGMSIGLGYMATEMALHAGASSIFEKDTMTVLDVTDHIEAKMAQNMLVNPDDLMLLRVAQNEGLAVELEAKYGKPYHKLAPQQRMQVIESMPSLFETTMRDATALNNRMVKPQDLALQQAPEPAKWSANRAKQQRQAGFRARIAAEQARAAHAHDRH